MTAWLLQNALVATLLGVGIAMTSRLFRISAPVRYSLWLVVVVRFVVPPVVSWPLSADGFAGRTTERIATVLRTASLAVPPIGDAPAGADIDTGIYETNGIARADWLPMALRVLWVSGALFLIFVYVRRYLALRRTSHCPLPVPSSVAATVTDIVSRMRVRAPPIAVTDSISLPVIAGMFRPVLLWPRKLHESLDVDQLRGVVAHELAHIRRGDHVRGIIESVCSIVWWWYPGYWIARRHMRDAAEQACDAWAVRIMAGSTTGAGPGAARRYADTLLEVAARSVTVQGNRPLAEHSFVGKGALHRRCEEIMRGENHPCLTRSSMAIIGLLTLIALPAWTVSQDRSAVIPMATAPTAFRGVLSRGEVVLDVTNADPVLLGTDSWFFAFEYHLDGTANLRYEAVRNGTGPIRTRVVVASRPQPMSTQVADRVRRLVEEIPSTGNTDTEIARGGAIVSGGLFHLARDCGQTVAAWTHGDLAERRSPGGYFGGEGFVGVFVHQAGRETPVRFFEVLGPGLRSAGVTISRDAVPGQVNPDEQLLLEESAACVLHSIAVARETRVDRGINSTLP